MNTAQRRIVVRVCWIVAVVLLVAFGLSLLSEALGSGADFFHLVLVGVVPPVLLAGVAFFVRAGATGESWAGATMNQAQRRVVLWVCRVLAGGCFLTFLLGFVLPWTTYKPSANADGGYVGYGLPVETYGDTIPARERTVPHPDFPFLALLWGVAAPVVLLGAGSFVSVGGRPEKPAETGEPK